MVVVSSCCRMRTAGQGVILWSLVEKQTGVNAYLSAKNTRCVPCPENQADDRPRHTSGYNSVCSVWWEQDEQSSCAARGRRRPAWPVGSCEDPGLFCVSGAGASLSCSCRWRAASRTRTGTASRRCGAACARASCLWQVEQNSRVVIALMCHAGGFSAARGCVLRKQVLKVRRENWLG